MNLAMSMSHVLLTSYLLSGCAHDGPGIKMLSERAQYEDDLPESSELNLGTSGALGEAGKAAPHAEPKVAQVWIYPQRLSETEHFWGGWLSLRLNEEQWDSKSMQKFKVDPPIGDTFNSQVPITRKKNSP